MKCSKCGTNLSSDGKFCPKCGTPIKKTDEALEAKGKTPSKVPSAGFALTGATVVLLAIGIATTVLFARKGNHNSAEVSESADTHNTGKDMAESDPAEGIDSVDEPDYLSELVKYESAQYNYSGLNVLDLSLRNYTPNQKQEKMDWDSSLFYTLEDVYEDSTEDNQITHYTMSIHNFINAQSKNVIQCFVYTHPDNGQINKIVTVEQQIESYLVSDYYYDNGKVNFVFTRTVDVYTPTYATIDKTGNRYYFHDDVMVRYRTISVPKQIVQQTLNPEVTWYPNDSYFLLDNEEKANYDAVEYQVLNEAYNVYDAIQNSGNIYNLEGYVYSAEGSPLANVSVAVIDPSSSSVLYSAETAKDGSYHIYISLDHTDCYLQVHLEEYLPVYIYDVKLDSGILGNSASCIYLSKADAAQTNVKLSLYNSIELTGNADAAALQNARVVIRSGINARNGKTAAEGSTGETGVLEIALAPGAYTAEYSLNGFAVTYENFYVTTETCIVKGYTVSTITDTSEKIVLCWNSDIDLDLVLYTPEKSAYGNMNYVNITNPADNYGNFLTADGTASRCEVMNISNHLDGLYKIYVNDYTDYQNGNFDSAALATSGARIYVYTSEGLIAVYYIDPGKPGIVWNVCEKGNEYHPCSIVSSQLNNYVLINKELITANMVLEMYREFLRGNVTADYQGNQITYNSLLWNVFGESIDIHPYDGYELTEHFALTDYNMDNIPELQIYYWSDRYAGCSSIYTVDLINGNLSIIKEEDAMVLSLYKDGSIGESWDSGPAGTTIIHDGEGNPLAYFEQLYYYSDDSAVDIQHAYEDYYRNYNGEYQYVYITAMDVCTQEAFEAYIEDFTSEYCGGEVTFYPVEESSIQNNLKWE